MFDIGPIRSYRTYIERFALFTYSLAMRDIEHEFSLIRTDRRVVPSGRLWNPAADVYQ